MKYLLITPVYNEEINIVQLIETVINQTVIPNKWIIVNNGSTDNTVNIIREQVISKQLKFVQVVEQPRIENAEGNENFNNAVNCGISLALRENQLKIDYIGKIDADVLLPPNFFQTLIEVLDENSTIGVLSATNYVYKGKNSEKSYRKELLSDCKRIINSNTSISDIRLYRRNAIIDIGGMPTAKYAPDSLTSLLLVNSGWGVMKTNKTHFITTRDANCSIPTFKNMVNTGKMNFYYGYPFISIIMKTCIEMISNRALFPVGILVGYYQSYLQRETQVAGEIKNIVQINKGPLAIMRNYINKL